MPIEQMLHHPDWDWDLENIYVPPNIPRRKLSGALGSYAPGVMPEEVIALIDDTVFGGAKEGLLVTRSGLYAKELFAEPRWIPFAEVQRLEMGDNARVMVNGAEFFKAVIVDHLTILTFVFRLASVLETGADVPPSDPPHRERSSHTGLDRKFARLHMRAMQVLRSEMGEDETGLCTLVEQQMRSVMRRLDMFRNGVRSATPEPLGQRELDAQAAEFGLLVFMVLHYYAFSMLPEEFRCEMGEDLSFLYAPGELYKDAFRAGFLSEFSVPFEFDEESMTMIPLMFFNRDGVGEFELNRPRAEVLQIMADTLRLPRHDMAECVEEASAALNAWFSQLENSSRGNGWNKSESDPESSPHRDASDPYEILGIRRNASLHEIELAYRGRRTQYHPDRYATADDETLAWATVRMQEVNEAYEILKKRH